eukprot:350825-Prorocentrum_lima.AAC.1
MRMSRVHVWWVSAGIANPLSNASHGGDVDVLRCSMECLLMLVVLMIWSLDIKVRCVVGRPDNA